MFSFINNRQNKTQKKRHFYYDDEIKDFVPINLQRYKLKCLSISVLSGFVLGLILIFIITLSIPDTLNMLITPKLMSQKLEIQNFKVRLQELNNKLEESENLLTAISERDEKLYRVTYDASPISGNQYQAGYGGSERYSDLSGYANSELLIQTSKRLDKLLSNISVQNFSLKELEKVAEEKEDFLKAVPSIIPIKNEQILRFSSGYGYRIDPFTHKRKMHRGVDLTVPRGTPIYATGDGIIERVDSSVSGYGRHIKINHGFGYQSIYAHLSRYNVRKGQRVQRGDLIGYSGNTGRSAGPHLHYEIIKDGVHQNPIHFYYGSLTPSEFDAIISKSAQITKSLD